MEQQSIHIFCEQLIPLSTPDDFDHVPAGASKFSFEFLYDLAIAAHRAVEPLQIAVYNKDQIIEPFAICYRERAESFGFIRLAVSEKCPYSRVRCIFDTSRMEVTIEASLIDSCDRSQAHRYSRKLPKIGHQPRMRIRRETFTLYFASEIFEVVF